MSTTKTQPGSSAHWAHTFAVEWENGEIRWYVDGVEFASRTSWFSTGGPFPAPFDVDFHLLLNLAVGGNLPGPPDASTVFPQEYVINWVRVYQVPNEPPVVTITSPMAGDPITPGDDLTITVSATDADGTIEKVQFLQDAALLGDDIVSDGDDACPLSDLSPTVVVDGCDSGVSNAQAGGGCNIGDEIAERAAEAGNHGELVSSVSHFLNELKKAGVITGAEKGAIHSCVAGSSLP